MLRPNLIFIVAVFILVTAPASSSPPLSWQEHLAAGEAIRKEDHQQARAHFAQALELAEAAGAKPLEIAHILERLAERIYVTSSQESEPFYLRALTIREQQLGKEDPSLAPILERLADISERRGCYERTADLLQRSLKIRQLAYGPGDPRTGRPLVLLSMHYSIRGNWELAEAHARRVLAIAEQAEPPDYDLLLDGLVALESAFRESGKATEADAVKERFFEAYDLYEEQKRQREAEQPK